VRRSVLHSCIALYLLHLKRDEGTIGCWGGRKREAEEYTEFSCEEPTSYRTCERPCCSSLPSPHARDRTRRDAGTSTSSVFGRVVVQGGIGMSFGSGFGASTSTPAPTFAFGTTPASTATPVKPGKPPFASSDCEFLAHPASPRPSFLPSLVTREDLSLLDVGAVLRARAFMRVSRDNLCMTILRLRTDAPAKYFVKF